LFEIKEEVHDGRAMMTWTKKDAWRDLWTTLGQVVKSSGLGDEPRRVLNELSKISLVDVVLPTSASVEIRKRCITRPTELLR